MKKNLRNLLTTITITTMVMAMAIPCLANQVRVDSLPHNEEEARGEYAPGLDQLPKGSGEYGAVSGPCGVQKYPTGQPYYNSGSSDDFRSVNEERKEAEKAAGVSGWEERELKTQPVKIQPLDEDPTMKREGPNREIAEKTGGQTPDYTIK